MAVAAIGGRPTSTSLSLIVAPVVFTLVDDVEPRIRRAARRGRAGQTAA